MRKNNTNEAKQKKKERESSESGGGKEQFASNDTKNKNARIVRNYKYIIIIIIIKRNPLHIKCYRVSELRPNAKYDFVAYITHVHTHTHSHTQPQLQKNNNREIGKNTKRNPRKRIWNILFCIINHAANEYHFLTAILIVLDLHVLLALYHSMKWTKSKCSNYLFDLNIAFMHIPQNAYQSI